MHIQQLLERYWEGETTLEEEKILYQYFEGAEIHPDVAYAAPHFQALRIERERRMPAPVLRSRRTNWYRMAGAAAAVVLLACSGWWLTDRYQRQQRAAMAAARFQQEVQTPEEAVEEIKVALSLVSSKLRKGRRAAAKGLHQIEKLDIIKQNNSK
jgi:D-serine deaminase-like pyridoxal phosphate-dependent protein